MVLEPELAEELYVARDEDVAALNGFWESAKSGTPTVVRLQSKFGGGRRALSGQFLSAVQGSTEDAVIWRVVALDQENGLSWLIRMYGSLIATLTGDVLRRGKIEMILNAQLPSQTKRVQTWFQQFITAMKEAKPDTEKGAIQLKLPQDNPLIGLVEVVGAISRKLPIILDLQNTGVVYSLALAQFLEALYTEGKENGANILVLLHDEPETDQTKSLFPSPLVDLYERRADDFKQYQIAPWGQVEAQKYLDSKGLKSDATRIAEIAGGRPGFIAELVEILEERELLAGDLSAVSFGGLVPLDIDASELEVPDAPPAEGERKHASADDVAQIVYLAALLGQAFPSGLVADMGGFDRDSVDDVIDAMGDLFEEVQFAKDLGTWIYKFKRGSWREGVIEQNDNDEGRDMARRVATFMERFLVPRGHGFIVKTARVYAEHGAPERSRLLGSIAISNDAPDIWGLCYDLMKYFDEVPWPSPMRRTVLMNLMDRMIQGGPLQTAERVHTDATEWAADNDDKDMTAWLLFAGSRLDLRRQDLYRARDRARDAKKLYDVLGRKQRMADIETHLAGLELQDGNPNAAVEHINQAIALAAVDGPEEGTKALPPNILAQTEHLRGLIARRNGDLPTATDHFRRSNEVAGQAGLAMLALDAGLAYGEALLAARNVEQALPTLRRVVQIAQSLRNPMRERSATELLAQAEGATKNFEQALQLAARTLQLTQALKFDQVLPIDLYNLGFFNYALNKPAEALTFFRQSEARIAGLGNHPVVKELHYFKGMAHLKVGEIAEAQTSLQRGLEPARAHKDWGKVVSAMGELAGIAEKSGDKSGAKKLLTDAIDLAQQANMNEQRKTLRKRLAGLA